ncbi:uncharacterized protein LOC117339573 [Pecten maximus]|uniref:uncharacterized protein LOC117339573 n=1 Tax=Pecten maximus TaxID=6579 RepID=UPI001458FA49|nr:uncharacterized protein LOC117339573 [Pecten maximus]
MLGKLWIGVAVSLVVGLIWVAAQEPIAPVQQIQAIQYRNFQLINEQQRRIAGWRQFYVNRLPYEYLIPIYFLVLLILRKPEEPTESCPSLPAADTLGVFCCGSFTTSATCQASPQNAQCTWDTGTCKYECNTFTTQVQCEGVGCTWFVVFVGICTV